jgi:CRP/FNR family transcriptional regulator
MVNQFQKGQVIFFEGNHPLGVFCISSGRVKLYKTDPEGKELMLRIARPGEYLGYRALVSEQPYSATAEALEPTRVCFFNRKDFFELTQANAQMNRELTRSLCIDLGLAYERMMTLTHKTVRERLAEVLLALWEKFALDQPEAQTDQYIGLQLPRTDLANLAATTTETAIRLLSEFKDDGYIRFEGKKIFLTDPKALRRLARVGG